MKKRWVALPLAFLVSFTLGAQTATQNRQQQNPASGTTTQAQEPGPAPQTGTTAQQQNAQPGVQAGATAAQNPVVRVQPGSTAKLTLPPPIVTLPPSTIKPKPQPVRPKTTETKKGPARGKDSQTKPAAASAGPMAWGTDFWHGTLRFNYWSAAYTGDVTSLEEVKSSGITALVGNKLNLVDDLKVHNPASCYEVEFWARPTKRNRFMGSYLWSQYTGKADNVMEKVQYGGTTLQFPLDIKSTLVSNRATFYYQFLPLADNRGGIGPLIGVEYYNIKLTLESEMADQKIDTPLNLVLPVVGVAGDYTLGYGVGLWGKLGWTGFNNVWEVSANYTDIEAGLSFKWKLLFAGVGYRALIFNVESGEKNEDGYLKLDTSQSGVVASLGVNF